MCKLATKPLIGHIALTSVVATCITLATGGVWFSQSVGEAPCTAKVSVTLFNIETESNCLDTYSGTWGERCEQEHGDEQPQGCAMWRPSLSLHIVGLVLVVCSISSAGSQACGCCCQGTKLNLTCSFGFTLACMLNMLLGFIMFTTAKSDLDAGRPMYIYADHRKYKYAWGWMSSLLSVLLLCITLGLIGAAAFCQELPPQDDNASAATGPVVVGRPVETQACSA
mmetsp:Transcript_65173/g.121490  ORF Transcript_65173/g.121490 Transcript_65173/m.121490 type:complete len:225 (-) Transcript_65173:66-740(-)